MYELLKNCPDEIVPRAEPRLTFLVEPRLKTTIARDIDALDALVRDEEWKAATVIGGSVVEALLFERLLEMSPRPQDIETAHIGRKDRGWAPAKPLDDWKLWKLIAVAHELGVIDDTVANVCSGARDFRNLIHPGKERSESPCDKGTALAAVAAVENLVATFNGSR